MLRFWIYRHFYYVYMQIFSCLPTQKAREIQIAALKIREKLPLIFFEF